MSGVNHIKVWLPDSIWFCRNYAMHAISLWRITNYRVATNIDYRDDHVISGILLVDILELDNY